MIWVDPCFSHEFTFNVFFQIFPASGSPRSQVRFPSIIVSYIPISAINISVHELVKCILCSLGNLVHVVPILAWKSVFHPVKTRLDTLFCPPRLWAHAIIFITPSVNTWVPVPLERDWRCFIAHIDIAWHILWPLFKMASESFLGRRMNTGEDSPGII